jgi:predicted DNA-binding transcriptional regulator AlpA
MARPEVTGRKLTDDPEDPHLLPPPIGPPLLPRKAFTIGEFCKVHGISRTQYYQLKKQGRAPQEMRLGPQSVRISEEAAHAWRKQQSKKAVAALNATNEFPCGALPGAAGFFRSRADPRSWSGGS